MQTTNRQLTIGGKLVRASAPYPAPEVHQRLCGRTAELRTLAAALMGSARRCPLSPLLVGPPGGGKNRLVYELASRCRQELYIVQGHEDLTPEDLVCAARFGDDPDAPPIEYVLSGLATAMLRGGICMVDELGKLRPRALAPLASVLDERRYLDSALLGERIHAHPAFRFVAATNSQDLAVALPEFITSRLRPVIRVEQPPRADIEAIVAARFVCLNGSREALFHELWDLDDHRKRQQPGAPALSPRDVVYLFSLAQSMADHAALNGAETEDELTLQAAIHPAEITVAHLRQAFCELFDAS